MRQRIAVGAGLLLAALSVSGSAVAQTFYPPRGLRNPALPPYEIMQVLSSHGLTPATRPIRRGPNYVLLATDRSGQQMRVVVDARLGDIVNLQPAGPGGLEIGAGPPLPPAAGVQSRLQPPLRSPPPAADIAPPAHPVPSPRVVANPPNPAPPPPASAATPTPPPPAAAAPGHPAMAAAEPPGLPPLPPPPPLPRPRPKLAEAPPEAPPAPAVAPPVARSPFPPTAAPGVHSEPQIE